MGCPDLGLQPRTGRYPGDTSGFSLQNHPDTDCDDYDNGLNLQEIFAVQPGYLPVPTRREAFFIVGQGPTRVGPALR
jgi:hypothetical protein